MFVTLLLSSMISHATVDKSKAELLSETGLSERELTVKTSKSVASYLYSEDAGVSCGMEDFAMKSYAASGASGDAYTAFTVTAEVLGPVGLDCGSYDRYLCYTTWVLRTGAWSVLGTECDEDTVHGE